MLDVVNVTFFNSRSHSQKGTSLESRVWSEHAALCLLYRTTVVGTSVVTKVVAKKLVVEYKPQEVI